MGGHSKPLFFAGDVCQNSSDCCPSEVEMVSSALMCCGYRIHLCAGVCRVEVLKLRVCGEASGL